MKKQKGESLFRTDLRNLLKMFDLQILKENDYAIQIIKKDKKAIDLISYSCLNQFNYFVKSHSKWNFSVFLNDKKQLILELKNLYLIDKLTDGLKEDIGLLMLMEEADKTI